MFTVYFREKSHESRSIKYRPDIRYLLNAVQQETMKKYVKQTFEES